MNHNPYPVVELNKWKAIKAEHPGAYIRSKAGKKGTIRLAIWGKHVLPVSWHPVKDNPSFEEAMGLSSTDIARIQAANDDIAGLTHYGRRIVKILRRGARIANWSNGSADWWLYAPDMVRLQPGTDIELDANQVIVYGISSRLTPYLDPLPLYGGSFESKRRGVFDPKVWLEGHGIEEEDNDENEDIEDNPHLLDYPYNLIHATRKERMISTIVGGVVGLLALWWWGKRG